MVLDIMNAVAKGFSSDLAPVFRALGDPTRLAILARLAGGEKCVCDLIEELGASQSRLSFHLKTLKTAGLVADRPEGRVTYYSLRSETAVRIRRYLEKFPDPASRGEKNR
jgi:ArsR family transcriptional regulator, arsenate/arsenite/antimonite-responsive transcriptional repressor